MSKKKEVYDFEKIKEDILEAVRVAINKVPNVDDGYRAFLAETIAKEAIIWGSSNIYEAIGIFEAAKKNYIERIDQILDQKSEECDCDECNCKTATPTLIVVTKDNSIN